MGQVSRLLKQCPSLSNLARLDQEARVAIESYLMLTKLPGGARNIGAAKGQG
jgi:hypothetical protein